MLTKEADKNTRRVKISTNRKKLELEELFRSGMTELDILEVLENTQRK